MSNSSTLPNPNVYLNYLSPELAFAWELTRDVYLVTCGALIWDILSSVPKDLKVFRRFNVGVLAYGLCRPTAFVAVLTAAIAKTSPLPHCHAIKLGTACLSIVATGTSTFLFLVRIQAVYSHSKLVRYAFFVLWLVQFGLSVLIPLNGSTLKPLYNTGYCINTRTKKSVAAAIVMTLIFDTLVFGFISYRLVTTHANHIDHSLWRTFFSGKTLPRLSKALLQGGQQYYLITVGMNMAIVALIASSTIPQIFQVILTIPGMALGSVMACNVHRNLLFEGRQSTEEEPGANVPSSLTFTDITSFLTRSYRSEGSTDNTGHAGAGALNTIPEVKTSPTTNLDGAV